MLTNISFFLSMFKVYVGNICHHKNLDIFLPLTVVSAIINKIRIIRWLQNMNFSYLRCFLAVLSFLLLKPSMSYHSDLKTKMTKIWKTFHQSTYDRLSTFSKHFSSRYFGRSILLLQDPFPTLTFLYFL